MIGTYTPPEAKLFMDTPPLADVPVRTCIYAIEQSAGAAIGSATIGYPANMADNPTPSMGDRAKIKIGNDVVFRGVVLHGPVEVNESEDMLQLVLMDDKYLLQAKIIGMPGIGNDPDVATGTYGFTDVGFDVVFNANGKPNKHATLAMFCLGSTATFWTLRDILNFLFTYYVPATIATIAASAIAHDAYVAIPSHLNLVGQTALQAIDAVSKLAGESWTLIPGANVSTFRAVRAGAGTARTARLFRPWSNTQVTSATEEHAETVSVGASIENCKDVHICVSKNIVVERVHTNTGSNALLTAVSGFKDKNYAKRWAVDVTKYATYALGRNRTAGSPAKPWLKNLATRLNTARSGYVTAAEIAATPSLAFNEPAEIPVWIATDGNIANVRLLQGGYRLDTEKGTIDLKAELDCAPATAGDNPDRITITTAQWSTIGIWLTVATDTGLPESATDVEASYLTTPFNEVISKTDLIPERRFNSMLPNLASTVNAYVTLAASAEEKYVDVTSKLQEAADFASLLSQQIETPIDVLLPFFPVWYIGDRLALDGRNLGATGNEVITAITFTVYETFETRVQATNVMAAVDPEKMARRRM